MAAIASYHTTRHGQSVGRHPLVTRFLHGALMLRPPAREAYAKWWIRMLFHSFESSDLLSPWASMLTLQKLAFGTLFPPTLVTPGSPFSRLSCTLPSRLHLVPKAFDATQVPVGERLKVMYTILPKVFFYERFDYFSSIHVYKS